MKFFAPVMLIAAAATITLAGPVMAQDRADKPAMEHRVTHHHVTYRRSYKSDQAEHQATEDLNRQYRGVPSDQH